jgi:hypothetical protein
MLCSGVQFLLYDLKTGLDDSEEISSCLWEPVRESSWDEYYSEGSDPKIGSRYRAEVPYFR